MTNGVDFTESAFERECSEAARRVLEMDRKYKMQAGKVPSPEVKKPPCKTESAVNEKPSEDRLLLLGIFLLLLTEGAEPPLLLALLYIML